ncbi:MAG: hypothetical protein IJD43_10945 [Thermoguttaceae bacterium]|nr:hypothetical protein [Planctomycetaceae bacterium]MBQ4143977.1 hypothetical protein [Thermoguttaceae bacterium]
MKCSLKNWRKISLSAFAVLLLGVCVCSVWSISALRAEENESENVTFAVDEITASSERALLCSSCAFGNGKDNCAKCGKWMASSRTPAYLCSSCAFGNGKTNCVKCGKWVASSGHPASICSSCAFGNGKTKCVKCGKWRG